jgi:Cytochrome c
MSSRAACTVVFALAGVWSLSPAWAQQAEVKRVQMRAIASVNGKDLYKEYCQSCHGEDLTGHGPASAGLRVPPPDLTTIALRNGGAFNAGAVEDRINGWKQIPRTMGDVQKMQHTAETGDAPTNIPVMPSFGPIFASLYGQEVRDRQVRMSNLIRYIKSQQVTASGERMK